MSGTKVVREPDVYNIQSYLNLNFTLISVGENEFFPMSYSMEVEMQPIESNDSREVLEKIKFWVDNVWNCSLALCKYDDWAYQTFIDSTVNNIILLPDIPHDMILIETFISKLNALGSTSYVFTGIKLTNHFTNVTTSYICTGDIELPEIEDWVDKNYYFKSPWWDRDDGTTVDLPRDSDEEVIKTIPDWFIDLSFISKMTNNSKNAEVIKFGKHKES